MGATESGVEMLLTKPIRPSASLLAMCQEDAHTRLGGPGAWPMLLPVVYRFQERLPPAWFDAQNRAVAA